MAHDSGQSPSTWWLLDCVDYHLTSPDIPNQGSHQSHRRLYPRLSVPLTGTVEDGGGTV
ncbi:hypothetical protein B296_00048396 [Ensete ventricosum]|uniref:Uncharacterized protein n=1 Tax=Ensete ventricosum TaxID=4639 RepID=A0A426YD69_ENSVE|nr:hypothetical protein B296_00048396 [Ensete ventricosum]